MGQTGPMILSRRTRATLAAAALLVGLSACGSDDDADGGATTTTAAAAESTTTGVDDGESTTTEDGSVDPDDADAMARAEAANVTIDDLPDGWTAEATEEDDGDDAFDRCSDVDLEAITVAKARSDRFEFQADDGGQMTISSTSGVLTSEDDATSMVDEFGSDAFAECVAEALRTDLGAAQMTGSFSVASSDELPDVADQVGALSGTFTITDPASGETVDLRAAVVAIRTGDLVSTLSVATVDSEGDGDLFESLVGVVAERQAG